MTEIPIIVKIVISLIFLLMFAVSTFLAWRLFWVKEKFKLLQADRNELLEERAKQSNKLRLKGIEIDEAKKEKYSDIMFRTIKKGETVIGELLSTLEKRMILDALNMPEYKNTTENPDMRHQILVPVLYRKAYKNLVEKIKENLKDES